MTTPLLTGLGRAADTIPTVGTTAVRDARYPSPPTGFKVYNVEVGAFQRYTGVAWMTAETGIVLTPSGGDDTGQIVAAITAAPVGANIVFMPGTYNVTPTVAVAATVDVPATTIAFTLKSHLHFFGYGATLRLADGLSTDLVPKSLDFFWTNEAIEDFSFHGITFDGNADNNPISPLRPASYNTYEQSFIRVSQQTGRADDVLIEDCTFKNTAGVSCVVMAESNFTLITLGRRWVVRNCTFLDNGLDSDDHSSIYGWADDVLIQGNRFLSTIPCVGGIGGHSAYEVHGANQQVVANDVDGYQLGFYVANNYSTPVREVVIAHNAVRTTTYGVRIFRNNSQAADVSHVLISDNNFVLRDDDTSPIGLKAVVDFTTALYAVSDIRIANNLARVEGDSVTSTLCHLLASDTAAQRHSRVAIDNNQVSGITLGVVLRTNATNGLGAVRVNGNVFWNLDPSDLGAAAFGVLTIQPAGAIAFLEVSNNSFVDDRGGSAAMAHGVEIAGAVTALAVGDNSYSGMTVDNYHETGATVTTRLDGINLAVPEGGLVAGVNASESLTFRTTLTAARVVGAPILPVIGRRIVFEFIQNGTGGWAVTWNAVFKVTWSDTGNTANKRTSIAFIYDGTNWNQDGAQAPYV
jgi:hypothetical protein